MVINNFFSHTGSDGSNPGQRIAAAGYSYSWWAENIAAGYSTAAGTFGQWRDSPGHCQGMMSSSATQIGASCVQGQSTAYRYYWTLNLGRPR